MTEREDKLAIEGGVPVRTGPLGWEFPGLLHMGKEELDLVTSVIEARSPFRFYGPNVQGMAAQLETEFARTTSRTWGLAVGSCTLGLCVSLQALGLGPGDEVLVAGYLWVSCLAAILRCGAIPRLVDIDDTFCMDPSDLERKITRNSKAVLLTHMNGAVGRLADLVRVARAAKLKVIEDCAQANGGGFRGRPVGSFGDLAVFSLQANKTVTSGEGGVIVGDDDELRLACFAGHDIGYPPNAGSGRDANPSTCLSWGVGAHADELTAAVAVAQMRKLPDVVAKLRATQQEIVQALGAVDGLRLRDVPDPSGDCGVSVIMTLASPAACERFVAALRAEGIRGNEGSSAFLRANELRLHWYYNCDGLGRRRGVTTGGWPWTDPANGFASDYRYGLGTLPNCDRLAETSAILAVAACLEPGAASDVIKAVRKVASKVIDT
jgi:dTDP-4-amino-4,6-dideoxygalactose transaminase